MVDLANPANAQAQIPRGVADYFWAEAYARRQLEGALLDLFRAWGYQDVIPPMFEYAETFLHRANAKLRHELYRFLDRDGSTLALRADMTIPLARLVGVRLHDWPMPQRFCYAGSVFRHTETQAGRQREFTQAGFELIGAATAAADAEVIALTVHAVRAAGIADFRLVLGQLQYFNALQQDLQLPPNQLAHFQRAIDRNSEADLDDFLRPTPLRTQQRHTVEQLPQLSGPDALAVIAHADRLCLNYAMRQALDNLRAIYAGLTAYGVTEQVYLDLTEINNLGYYTGISFEVLTPGLGFALGSGGRYDNLIGSFGPAQPAVGVALGLDRLLHAHPAAQTAEATQPIAPHLVVATGNHPECLAILTRWRAAGLRVTVSLDDRQGDALWQQAQRDAVPFAATWTGHGFDLWGVNGSDETIHVSAEQADAVIELAQRTRAHRSPVATAPSPQHGAPARLDS